MHTWMLHPFARICQLQPARLKMVAKNLPTIELSQSLSADDYCSQIPIYFFLYQNRKISVLPNQWVIRLIQLVLFSRGRSVGILALGLRRHFTAGQITQCNPITVIRKYETVDNYWRKLSLLVVYRFVLQGKWRKNNQDRENNDKRKSDKAKGVATILWLFQKWEASDPSDKDSNTPKIFCFD